MDRQKYLDEINKVIKEGIFDDDWGSLTNYKLADRYRIYTI